MLPCCTRYPARVPLPWRILLLAMTDQQLWNILDRPGNPCYTRHVGLSTRKLYTFQLCMCVWSTDDSIKNRAVTNQRDRSYVGLYGDAVISSPRPADRRPTIAGSNLINLRFLPMELVSDALHSSNMRI